MDTDRVAPVIEAALETRVYANDIGTITIEQFDPGADEVSPWGRTQTITIHPRHLGAVIAALQQASYDCDA
jgi:hypothetical protein